MIQKALLFFVLFLLSLVSFQSRQALATMLFNPPYPYPQFTSTATSFTISIAGNPSGTPSSPSFIDNNLPFKFIVPGDTSSSNNWILVDVSSNSTSLSASTATQNLVVTLSVATGGAPIPIIGAGGFTGSTIPTGCNGCQAPATSGTYYSVVYTPNTILRLAFRLYDLCNVTGAATTMCSTGAVMDSTGTTLTQLITATIGLADPTTAQGPTTAPASGGDSGQFTLNVTDIAPEITGPSTEGQYYFPGDSSIILQYQNSSSDPGQNSTTGVSGVSLYQYVVLANLNASGGVVIPSDTSLTAWLTGNSVPIHYSPYGVGTDIIPGFQNASSATDSAHDYSVSYYVENAAGIMSTAGATWSSVKSQAISGILTESKCFIATATYHDGHAAPVMMLRHFRDEVLSKFSLGRKFIENYYRYSPPLAEWAWDKPLVRSLALRVLTPIEIGAWLILKFTHADQVNADSQASSQPFIDHIKQKLEAEEQAKKKGSTEDPSGSYIESIKKTLDKDPAQANSGSYIDSIKKDLPPAESTDGFTEKEKAKPNDTPERESTIKLVKEGRDKIVFKKKEDAKNLFSFKVGINPGTQVSVNGGSPDLTYTSIYGSSWNPDVFLHYERFLFNNTYGGTFSAAADLGIDYASGFGLLAFAFPTDGTGSRVSQTRFSFIQVPVLVGGMYRINWLDVVRPYAGASVGTMGYVEVRNDAQKDKRGYSFIYTATAGVSLLLDYFDKKTSQDAYLSDGIQHVYLFAEYLYMNTFSGNVIFKRGGLYSGFAFEF